MKERGLTLLELICVLAILALLLQQAVPDWRQHWQQRQLERLVALLESDVRQARVLSLLHTEPFYLCARDGCGARTWTQGWALRSADGALLRQRPSLPTGWQLAVNRPALRFAQGRAGGSNASLELCRDTLGVRLVLARSGRLRRAVATC